MTSVRLPKELEERLASVAKASKRSKGYVTREALEHYLNDVECLHIASERMRNPGKCYTTEEVKKALGLRD